MQGSVRALFKRAFLFYFSDCWLIRCFQEHFPDLGVSHRAGSSLRFNQKEMIHVQISSSLIESVNTETTASLWSADCEGA